MTTCSATPKNGLVRLLLLSCLLLRNAKADWVETAKLTDINGEPGDSFGFSFATEDGILAVGVYGDDEGAGSVRMLELVDGEFRTQQKLSASDAETYDFFGYAVAIYNGILAVGAPFENGRIGAVYIYGQGTDGVWTEKQKLVHSDAATLDEFGWSLAMHDDTLIVGVRGDDSYRGSVQVYTLLDDIWTQAAELTASDSNEADLFGYTLAIYADTIVVGAQRDDDMGDDSGSAYVFQRVGVGGSWTCVEKLTPQDGQPGDRFGYPVAIEGETVWLGSQNNVDGDGVGAAFVFGQEQDSWTQKNKLVASDLAPGDRFGHAIAIRNDTLVVGAFGQANNTGAVYLHSSMEGTWVERAKLVASDGVPDDWFGWNVAVEDGLVLVGAHGDNNEQGSVYVFEWHASEILSAPTSAPTSPALERTSSPTSQSTSGAILVNTFKYILVGAGATVLLHVF